MTTPDCWHPLGPAGGLDLDVTLSSGQCFRWQRAGVCYN